MIEWTENEAKFIAKIKQEFAEAKEYKACLNNAKSVKKFINEHSTHTLLGEKLSREYDRINWNIPRNLLWMNYWKNDMITRLARFATGKSHRLHGALCSEISNVIFDKTVILDLDSIRTHLPEYFPGHQLKKAALEGNVELIKLLLDVSSTPEKKLRSVYHIMLNKQDFQSVMKLNSLCGNLDKISFDQLYKVWLYANVALITSSKRKACYEFDRYIFKMRNDAECLKELVDLGTINLHIPAALDEGVSLDVPVMKTTDVTLKKLLYFLYEFRNELREWLIAPYASPFARYGMYPKLGSLLDASEVLAEFESGKHV